MQTAQVLEQNVKAAYVAWQLRLSRGIGLPVAAVPLWAAGRCCPQRTQAKQCAG